MTRMAAGAFALRSSVHLSSSPACLHQTVAAWPWVDPVVDVSPKPRVPREQAESRSIGQKVDLSRLLDKNFPAKNSTDRRDEDGRKKVWLPDPPVFRKPRSTFNAATLAYMGDAIFELYVRRHLLTPQPMDTYNQRVMALVCCEAQHALLQKLVKVVQLSDEERDVLRWGRNVDAGNKAARRRAGGLVYNSASALETFIGFLYLTNPERLDEVMKKMGFSIEADHQNTASPQIE